MLHLLAQNGAVESVAFYALPLVGSVLVAYGLYQVVRDLQRPESRKVESRLKDRGASAQSDRNEAAAKASIMRQQRFAETTISGFISSLRFIPSLQQTLEQANLGWSATTFLLNVVGLGALTYIGLYFLGLNIYACVGGGIGGVVLPIAFVFMKRKMRMNKFLNQLPDVFDLMGQALRAGHSLPSAIHVVSQQMTDPAGTEFARVFYEQNLGVKIEEAMLSMANRVKLLDVKLFVTAVLIQRQTGGDLAEVLDNISGVIRERIKLFGQVKALTAEGRLSGYVLFALPFAVFGVEQIINPEYGQVLLQEKVGNYMLITACVMQLLGLAMIKKIVNIKV